MTFTTETLASYLGLPVSAILATEPFMDWAVERSLEDETEPPRIYYEFAQDGVDVVCDDGDNVAGIILFGDESRCYKDGLQDVSFSFGRGEVLKRLGRPAKSGGVLNDPVLGKLGPWDRFAKDRYSIHVQYGVDSDRVERITLMRADFVP
ncbi:MAG: hypothetical protein R3C52_08615 [Hyphomonadaceae bacterium]